MIALPLLLALALAPPAAGSVELEGAHAIALREAAKDPGGAPAGPAAITRTVRLVRTPAGTELRARWRIVAGEPGWLAGRLVSGDVVVRSVTIDGRPAAAAGDSPTTHVLVHVDREVVLELDAIVRGDVSRGPIELGLLPAVRGTVTIDGAPSWRVEAGDGSSVVREKGVAHVGAGELRIVEAPPPSDEGDAPLAIGRVGIGVLIGEAEIRGRARTQWVLRRGELASVAFTAKHVGDDLKVEGPEVREVKRDGDRVTVSLQSPQRGTVALELSWSQTTPKGDTVLTPPEIVLEGASRTEVTLALGRDGDIDVVPELEGWRGIAAQELPQWGRDLIEGTPSASFTRHGPAGSAGLGKLQLLRFVPVEAPPVVIQQARFTLAVADHGSTLVQVRYEVVNERASHLRVGLPARARLLAVEVGGEEVRPGGDGTKVLVPIKRSLETVEGLLSTPVVISYLLEDRAWQRREDRELALCTVDAPIRKTVATVILPRDTKATIDEGEAGVTSVYHVRRPRHRRGRSYADTKTLGAKQKPRDTADKNAADAPPAATPVVDTMREAEGDRLLEEATDYYNMNEFDEAQRRLDELDTKGLGGEDARRLQSNLDIVNAPEEPAPAPPADYQIEGSEVTVTGSTTPMKKPAARVSAGKMGVFRRVKEQARARAGRQIVEQRERKKKAEKLRAQGDYKAAEEEYRRALEVNEKLKKLEQDEDRTYDFEDDAIQGEIEATKSEAAAKDYVESASQSKLVDPSLFDPDGEHGLGAEDAWTPHAFVRPLPPLAIDPPRPVGPRVIMPTHGGDVVSYEFDLWAPGSSHALSIRARKRVRLPPR